MAGSAAGAAAAALAFTGGAVDAVTSDGDAVTALAPALSDMAGEEVARQTATVNAVVSVLDAEAAAIISDPEGLPGSLAQENLGAADIIEGYGIEVGAAAAMAFVLAAADEAVSLASEAPACWTERESPVLPQTFDAATTACGSTLTVLPSNDFVPPPVPDITDATDAAEAATAFVGGVTSGSAAAVAAAVSLGSAIAHYGVAAGEGSVGVVDAMAAEAIRQPSSAVVIGTDHAAATLSGAGQPGGAALIAGAGWTAAEAVGTVGL